MYKKIIIFFISSFLTAILLIPVTSSARIYLFDNKLEIVGNVQQKVMLKFHMKSWEKGEGENGYLARGGRMKNPAMLKTHFHIEGLYHIHKSEKTTFDFYTLWEWFYDWSPDIRGDIHRSMSAYDRNKYQTPHGEDMCREMYINFVHGPWTLRLGKQQVVWGETSLQRTADVVNTIDLRSHLMGVDDWEDFKVGNWMFRGFYQTSFSNDLTFEWVWIPQDFQHLELPVEGTAYNTTYTAGWMTQFERRMRHDAKDYDHGLHDSQGGFRFRGYNWDWDWTLIYFNGYNPGATVYDWGNRKDSYKPTTPFGWTSYKLGVGGFNLYTGEYFVNFTNGDPLPRFPTNKCFKYYRIDNFGATATKYFQSINLFGTKIITNALVRFEFAYKEGVHFNRIDKNNAAYGITQRDQIAYGLEISRDFYPQWILRYNDQRSVDLTFSLYQDWILNHAHYLGVSGLNHGYGDRSSTTIGIGGSTYWMKDEIYTRWSWEQNLSGSGSFYFVIQYGPGNHWRFQVMPRYSWSNTGPFNNKEDAKGRGKALSEKTDTLNFVCFKIIYLF